MSALDRFDEWADGLDDELARVYDEATLRAIDRRAGEPDVPPTGEPRPVRGWRGGATAGALVVGLVQGVADALDDDESEPVVEIDEELSERRLEPVTVHIAWGNPAASVAIVRRWLF